MAQVQNPRACAVTRLFGLARSTKQHFSQQQISLASWDLLAQMAPGGGLLVPQNVPTIEPFIVLGLTKR